ncbi:hypothetical protein CLOSTHATH_05829 [Hungatella hathewayi DSM 13479]|uniref:Uncharacterized protein n=1 Tax=Hungatella hathewayi DSM 13479 TaxID=566550 RepID=D3AQC3_9FIRM|nr:hypothetical protein CLOSTHATH_05829 [Hungatella hathewayi DSM 13479]
MLCDMVCPAGKKYLSELLFPIRKSAHHKKFTEALFLSWEPVND